jgi:hypothetical protein
MRPGFAALLRVMDEEVEAEVPVLISLGEDDVPVCADGSCSL